MTQAQWQPFDAGEMVTRLREAQDLLEQAMAVAAAGDGAQLAAMAELQHRLAEDSHGDQVRRRYR